MFVCSLFPSSEHDLGEDIYDCVPCEDEGDDIYEDIIKVEVQQPMVRGEVEVAKSRGRGSVGCPGTFSPFPDKNSLGNWEGIWSV